MMFHKINDFVHVIIVIHENNSSHAYVKHTPEIL